MTKNKIRDILKQYHYEKTHACTTTTVLAVDEKYVEKFQEESLPEMADRQGLFAYFFPRHNPVDKGKWVIGLYRRTRHNRIAFKSDVLPYADAELAALEWLAKQEG